MTTLERIGLEALGGVLAIAAVLLWWNLHNRAEQKIGAAQCIQTTTIDKTEAKKDAAADQAAGAVDVATVVKGYDEKVNALQRDNDALARRLLASGSIHSSRVPDSGGAAGSNCPVTSVSDGESQARERSAADLLAVLNAADANQVRTEDCAKLYNGVRDRAIAAAAELKR